MARTWSLDTTLTNAAAAPPNFAPNADHTKLFFIETNKLAVISWDGTTETDISGSTWSGNNVVQDLCWFNGTLYAAVDDDPGANYDAYIYSWDGTGQSWTLEFTVADGGTSYRFETGGTEERFLGSDGNRIVAVAVPSTSVERLFASTDGSTWAIQTIDGGTDFEPKQFVLGTYQTELTEVILTAFDSPSDGRAINYGSGNDWDLLSASDNNVPDIVLVGQADGKTFWDSVLSNYIEYSTDYGVNRTATTLSGAGTGNTRIQHIHDSAIMTRSSYHAYVWDSGTNNFVADGDTGTDSIVGFFRIGNTLYAFCGVGRIYSGGSLPPSIRYLGMVTDSENLYLSGIEGGTGTVWTFDQDTLTEQYTATFGAIDYGDPDTLTAGIWPVGIPGADYTVYLYGLDGDDYQIQYSDDAGETFTDLSDGGWGSSKFAVALLIDPMDPTDMVAVFSDDDIYRSRDGGTTWTKIDDAAINQRRAARHPIDELDLILAGQSAGAGELHYSPNLGRTNEDISDAGLGTINVIVAAGQNV